MHIYNSPVSFKGPATDALRRQFGLRIDTADIEGLLLRVKRQTNLKDLVYQAASERLATLTHPFDRSEMEDLQQQLNRIA